MIFSVLPCILGLPAALLLIRRIPLCSVAEPTIHANFSIIIPARNEEKNLPRLLHSIELSTIRPAEILVVDDGSSDDTAVVARNLGANVLKSTAKPTGLTGKSWACYQGAQNAGGDLLLFLDADTFFLPGGLDRFIATWRRMRDQRLAISVLPYHVMGDCYEQLSLVFNMLMAAGGGGFAAFSPPLLFGQSLLIAKSAYLESGGHAVLPGIVLENLRLANKLRNDGIRLQCLGGKGVLHMRMFPDGIRQMSDSWTKGFIQGASDSAGWVLLFAIVWISALWSTIFLLLIPPADFARTYLAGVYLILVLQMYWIARQLGSYGILTCLFYPLPVAYFCLIFGRAGIRRLLRQKTVWRGREV